MTLIISIVIGALIGFFFNLDEKFKNINSNVQLILLVFLLFFMGLSIGANEKIINNLKTIGLASFTFASLTTLVSIGFVFIIGKFIIKENNA